MFSDCLPILTLCFITAPDSRGGSNEEGWYVSYIMSVRAIRLTPCFVCVQVSNPFSSAGQQPEGGDASTTVSEGRRALRQLVSFILILVWAIRVTSCFVFRYPPVCCDRSASRFD